MDVELKLICLQYFGTEYSVSQLNDGTFMNIANNKEEFGAVTPENEMKVRLPFVPITM